MATQRAVVTPTPVAHSLSAVQAPQRGTDSRGVVVHWLVFGLQLLPPHADSFWGVHWTQLPAEQIPLPAICVQSASAWQAPQVFDVVSQREAAELLHSVFARQATQVFFVVLHTGDALFEAHSDVCKQPTQVLVSVSQTGLPGTMEQS